jgi:hypothetical protein
MCDHRLRDLKRNLSTLAAEYAATVEINHTRSGHYRATFTVRGKTVDVITSSTPSDRRHHRNNYALVRRLLRGAA